MKWVKRRVKHKDKSKDENIDELDEQKGDSNVFDRGMMMSETSIRSDPAILSPSTSSSPLKSSNNKAVPVGDDDPDIEEVRSDKKEDEEDIVDEFLFAWWKFWNHIGFNRAYLFRYGFRMCDVFSRLMILALIWSSFSGAVTLCILAFEVTTFVVYAYNMGKYNFFQVHMQLY